MMIVPRLTSAIDPKYTYKKFIYNYYVYIIHFPFINDEDSG